MHKIEVIPGFPGYGVNDQGKVFSRVIRFHPGEYSQTWHERKTDTVKGYLRVTLTAEDGTRHRIAVHRLVAQAFIGNIPEGWEVNHRDFNRANNAAENLEIVTSSGNKIHSSNHGRAPRATGQRNGQAKLNMEQVAEIRRRREAGETQAAIAKDFNLSQGMVSRIGRGLSWQEAQP